MKIQTKRERKRTEIIELSSQVNKDKFDDYKEKQKIFKARSSVGKWFHIGGTYKKNEPKEK